MTDADGLDAILLFAGISLTSAVRGGDPRATRPQHDLISTCHAWARPCTHQLCSIGRRAIKFHGAGDARVAS